MSDFEKLSNVFDYAFLDPFSKVFLNQSTFQILILKRKQRNNNKTELIALGGITSERIKTALNYGFDDVAL
jgi:thiamine-phosphate pyrophosphorylase